MGITCIFKRSFEINQYILQNNSKSENFRYVSVTQQF